MHETLWKEEILPSIKAKQLPGFIGMDLMKRNVGGEIEYTTMIRFESLEGIKQFAGQEYERAVVPVALQNLLKRWDKDCVHCDLVTQVSK